MVAPAFADAPCCTPLLQQFGFMLHFMLQHGPQHKVQHNGLGIAEYYLKSYV
jgi:hypothetical protein